jgi:hypothetical protein
MSNGSMRLHSSKVRLTVKIDSFPGIGPEGCGMSSESGRDWASSTGSSSVTYVMFFLLDWCGWVLLVRDNWEVRPDIVVDDIHFG